MGQRVETGRPTRKQKGPCVHTVPHLHCPQDLCATFAVTMPRTRSQVLHVAGLLLSFRFYSADTSSTPWILEDIGNKVEMVPGLKQLTVFGVRHRSNYNGGEGGRKYLEWGCWAVRRGISKLQFPSRPTNLGTTLRNTSLEAE